MSELNNWADLLNATRDLKKDIAKSLALPPEECRRNLVEIQAAYSTLILKLQRLAPDGIKMVNNRYEVETCGATIKGLSGPNSTCTEPLGHKGVHRVVDK